MNFSNVRLTPPGVAICQLYLTRSASSNTGDFAVLDRGQTKEMAVPAARFFFLVDLATGLFMLWAFLRLSEFLDPLSRNVVWIAWTLLLLVMLFRRGQDEFWDLCWSKASTAAFAGLLIVPPLILFTLSRTGQEAWFDHDVLVLVLFGVFFARFQWARYRGGVN